MAKRLSEKDFEFIYKRAPRLCVDLVVKNKDGFLLTLRNIPPAIGFWHLPGGTVLHGEPLEKAVKRVARLELGVDVEIIKELGIVEYLTPQTNFGHALSVAFLIKLKNVELKLDRQASEFKFFKQIPEKTLKEVKLFLKSQ